MRTRGELKANAISKLKKNWVFIIKIFLIGSIVSLIANVVIYHIQLPIAERMDYYYELIMNSKEIETVIIDSYLKTSFQFYAVDLIGVVGTIFGFFFSLPAVICMLSLESGEKCTFKESLKRAGESFKLCLLMWVKIFLWSLLFIIPGLIKAISYSLAPIIKAKNPERSSSECIEESQRLMNGYKSTYFILLLSFIGWFLLIFLAQFGATSIPYVGAYLSILVSWISYAVLDTYIGMTQIMFYNDIVRPQAATPVKADAEVFEELKAVKRDEVFEELNAVKRDEVFEELNAVKKDEVFEELNTDYKSENAVDKKNEQSKKMPDIFGDFYDDSEEPEEALIDDKTEIKSKQEKHEDN